MEVQHNRGENLFKVITTETLLDMLPLEEELATVIESPDELQVTSLLLSERAREVLKELQQRNREIKLSSKLMSIYTLQVDNLQRIRSSFVRTAEEESKMLLLRGHNIARRRVKVAKEYDLV